MGERTGIALQNSERKKKSQRGTLFQARKRQWIMATLHYMSYISSSLVVPGVKARPFLEIAVWYTGEQDLMALDTRVGGSCVPSVIYE